MPDDSKLVFKGVIFDVYQWQQKMYDGTFATFEQLKRADAVAVIPVLPDGKILLIEEEQPNYKRMHIDLPMGRIEEGEDPLHAAKRELLEETGHEASEWILFHSYQPVNKIEWAIFTFVAKGVRRVAEKSLDIGEKIELKPVSRKDFFDLVLEQDVGGPPLIRTVLEAKLDPDKSAALESYLRP
jgi:8-oxo-dGTP pyrophosphatase MutT (NUDIX family)